jgi:hypothetical protein
MVFTIERSFCKTTVMRIKIANYLDRRVDRQNGIRKRGESMPFQATKMQKSAESEIIAVIRNLLIN